MAVKHKVISALILLITIIPVFILPIFGIDYWTYGIFSFALITSTIFIGRINKALFSTILFFTIIHISRPLCDWFTDLININFPGTYYLIPILAFTLLILTIPSIKKSISWWTQDKIDRKSILLIAVLSIVSGFSLFIWATYLGDNLHNFKESLPNVPISWIILNGIGFAIFNSLAEEFLSRGMLCNGLEKLFSNRLLIIVSQAIIFSIFHFLGFPGGLIGMIMVFSWSIVLGIIRYRTKGLVGVLIGHFWADLTIYFILYGLK